MYYVWVIKYGSGCCRINKDISYRKSGWSAMCVSCESVVERTPHVMRCREPGRKKMLRSSVGELMDWVCDMTDDYDMEISLSKYLLSQGEIIFEETGYEHRSAPEDSCD